MSVSQKQEEDQRLNRIRAGFILNGTSLHRWCLANSVDYSNFRKAISGKWGGPKAHELIARVEKAAGVATK